MRRLAVLSSLIAALAGTPLRQAEAASDFARATSLWFEPASLQTVDGGVGDDSGVVMLTATQDDIAADCLPAALFFILPPDFGLSPITPVEVEGLNERVWWPTDPTHLRNAWLQVFLI